MGDNLSSDLIRGHIDTMILRVLLNGDSYGYEIIKAIAANSDRAYELKEPSLYSSLKRLETGRQVQSYWGDESQGGRRKYYRVTEYGRECHRQSVEAWKAAKTLIDRLIEGSRSDG